MEGITIGILLVIVSLVFIGLGILVRRKPDVFWRTNEAWKVRGEAAPSDSYLESMRFRGFVSLIIGGYFLVWAALVIFL
ncbi:DUF6199 family natural product biosynthesis protein [uncultured Paenibacillus sp.]|uniref:DUF6199 family natural product biosynthesis protein n=1 Tax=uncultured Paenibacillus sp. TaxID=227322 RepID=UPI0035A58E73